MTSNSRKIFVLAAFAAFFILQSSAAVCDDGFKSVGAINQIGLRPIQTIQPVTNGNTDSDDDGIVDSEEGDRDGDGELGPNECDPKLADTDGDGVPDGEERRLGTKCSRCDTDEDGLSDGVELGKIQPDDKNGCHGLYAAGTNYRKPHVMDPLNPDSDGDGLTDGEEDKNGNGWVDPDETDPSIENTDTDDLSDYVEATGDFNDDRLPDFDVSQVQGEGDCRPPESIADIDCDGIPNGRDDDSDNDGCPDAQEGGWIDANANGIPDVYDNEAKLCPEVSENTPSQGGGGKTPAEEEGKTAGEFNFPRDGYDGSSCALIQLDGNKSFMTIPRLVGLAFLILIAACSVISLARRRA